MKKINKKLSMIMLGIIGSSLLYTSVSMAKDTLKVGTDLTYPPYNYFDANGKPAGFDVELMSALGDAIGYDVNFMDTRFENLIIGVRGSQFDIIASTLYVNGDRAKHIDYIPYMKTGVSIAVNSSSELSFINPEDLCGFKVGSIKGGAWIDNLMQLNQGICKENPIDSREFPTSPEVTQALLSRGIDAQMEDSAVLQDAAMKLNDRIRITSTENHYPVVVGLGVQKGNEELIEKLVNAMSIIDENGIYDELLRKYNLSKPTEDEFKAALAR